MLISVLPDDVKITITIDDIRFRSKLTITRKIRFNRKRFSYTRLSFTQSHSGSMNGPPEAFIQMLAGTYKSDKLFNITGKYKIHLKCDCFNGSTVNGIREPISYSFALDKPPGHRIYKKRTIIFLKVNKSVLFHITFFSEDDGYKPVKFIGETILFICQLINS